MLGRPIHNRAICTRITFLSISTSTRTALFFIPKSFSGPKRKDKKQIVVTKISISKDQRESKSVNCMFVYEYLISHHICNSQFEKWTNQQNAHKHKQIIPQLPSHLKRHELKKNGTTSKKTYKNTHTQKNTYKYTYTTKKTYLNSRYICDGTNSESRPIKKRQQHFRRISICIYNIYAYILYIYNIYAWSILGETNIFDCVRERKREENFNNIQQRRHT